MESILPIEKIKELLPQKEPFVMVNHLLEYSETAITTGFEIEKENIFIEEGCFNESGMIENIAQSTALHTSYDFFKRNEKAPVGYIGTISNVKLFKRPKIGMYLTTKVEIIKEFMGITLVVGQIFCENTLMFEAKIKTFIAE